MLTTERIFQNGMLLQRHKEVPVWGTGIPGRTVTVSMGDLCVTGVVSQKGKWQVKLPPMEASVHNRIRITDGVQELWLEDVAVGEVWIAAGQSNMEFPMCYERSYKEALQDCCNENLRFYDAPEVSYPGNLEQFDYSEVGIWRKADRENLGWFSAVGYYFQKEIFDQLNVPVGIVGCNFGGTCSAAWTSQETVARLGDAWMKRLKEKEKVVDFAKFWEAQKSNPRNDRSKPCMDPFSALMLPGTPTWEEIWAFISENGMEPPPQMEPQHFPGALYEHMVLPIAPYAARGVLWYQGESDDGADTASIYDCMLEGMIGDWRSAWRDELPFLIVQLPGFEKWMQVPSQCYPLIRQKQMELCDRVPGAHLCSIGDVGERYDIHPKDKKTVGHRLSLLAHSYVYEACILCDPPKPDGIKVEGDCIRVRFANAGQGLHICGSGIPDLKLICRGEEMEYRASVEGDCLLLLCSAPVREEVTVAFAQAAFFHSNLYNSGDIPAIPFVLTVKNY